MNRRNPLKVAMRVPAAAAIVAMVGVALAGPANAADFDTGWVARSQHTLGKMYDAGLGADADAEAAFFWVRKAAQQGFDRAQYSLGEMYRDGAGTRPSLEAAFRWFLRAAEQGYAKAQEKVGARYARGEGVAQDEARALAWTTLAADQGIEAAIERRKDLLGRLNADAVGDGERLLREWQR